MSLFSLLFLFSLSITRNKTFSCSATLRHAVRYSFLIFSYFFSANDVYLNDFFSDCIQRRETHDNAQQHSKYSFHSVAPFAWMIEVCKLLYSCRPTGLDNMFELRRLALIIYSRPRCRRLFICQGAGAGLLCI